jgi:hypothetical protein
MSDQKQSLFDDEEEEGKFLVIQHLQNTPQHKSPFRSKLRATKSQLSRSLTPTPKRKKKMSTSRK